MIIYFNANDWYWFVAGDQSRAYSSAQGRYVPVNDPAFMKWMQDGGRAHRIDTEANLSEVLKNRGLPAVKA